MADKLACEHLRVRLSADDKAFLGSLSQKHDGKPNFSRAVKGLIEKERSAVCKVEIFPETKAKIERLARLLRRANAQVIDESFDAILEQIDSGRVPLLVMELKLARSYARNPKRKLLSR